MQLQDDYFLLYHGKNSNEIQSANLGSISDEYYPILSLILILKKNNFNKIVKLTNFKELFLYVYSKEISTLDEIYPIQQAIFSYLNNNESSYNIDILIKHLKYLHDKEILPLDNYKKLISLFESFSKINDEKNIIQTSKIDTMTFHGAKSFLIQSIELLDKLFSTDSLKQELVQLKNYLQNQIFSIGITGVINSGKSTMLNALIGKEILGSSVVPETANLTILKYAKPSAKVFYWNEEEWSNIVHGAQSIESMKDFVEETEKKFGSQLKKYITKESFNETISVDDISNYTSVKSSDSKCNLVKYVELYYDLEFLKDGIEIVDTPGLDDPVIQREEITKEYLSRCDVMLHLMNVSQSATAKDVDFIIDAILYQYISKILIVITHADSVSKQDIQEVIAYTKFSIKEQLARLNKSSRVDYILEHIDFIPISAKVALLHKTNPTKAQECGMSMKESGFLKLEEYLQETLFSKQNNKSELIIRSASEKLKEYMNREIHLYTYALKVLSQSKTELQDSLKRKKEKHSNALDLIIQDINMYKDESIHHLKRLDTFLNEEFIDLKSVIKERLFGDVKYSYKTDKKIPDQNRSRMILQTALKDGIIEIIRDYRYKFSRKEESYIDNYERKIKNIDPNNESHYTYIDTKDFFKDTFLEGFLTFSTDVFVSKVLNAIKNSKSSKLELLNDELYSIIEEEMSIISKQLYKRAKEQALRLIDELFALVLKNINIIKERFDKEESFIQDRLDNYDENSEDSSTVIMQKMKEIEVIKSGFNI